MSSFRSFRDPAGSLVDVEGRLLRIVTDPQAAAQLPAILDLATVRDAVARKRFVASRIMPLSERAELRLPASAGPAELVLEHERVAFPSYPYEWPPEMLHAAGRLTLDLALELLNEGYGLKDATPYNVLFGDRSRSLSTWLRSNPRSRRLHLDAAGPVHSDVCASPAR